MAIRSTVVPSAPAVICWCTVVVPLPNSAVPDVVPTVLQQRHRRVGEVPAARLEVPPSVSWGSVAVAPRGALPGISYVPHRVQVHAAE